MEDTDVITAHWLGDKSGVKDRSMVVQVTPELRQQIFKYTKNLESIKNEQGKSYFIEAQLFRDMCGKKETDVN